MENNSLRDQLSKSGILTKDYDILKVNFGNIDSDSDQYLYDYFLDDEYVQRVVYSDKYFISGRKGTGKTALYRWIKYSEMKHGYQCSNMNLTDLNQADFGSLSDDNKPSNSVYQTIWEYIILCEIARMIVNDPNCYFHSVEYQELRQYINFFYGNTTLDMHKLVLEFTSKKGFSLIGPPLKVFYGKHENYTLDKTKFASLSKVNNRLSELITNYLADNKEKLFILQFDGLDNDYNYEAFDNYKKIIISLLTATYELNNQFREKIDGLKIITYLRSDIFRAVHDYHPNSAKWTFLMMELDWSIKIERDFSNSKLKKMIDVRIKKSLPTLESDDAFEYLFSQLKKSDDSFEPSNFTTYLKRTMFRPRDLVALCIYTQNRIRYNSTFNNEVDKEIRKEYIAWFWSEISNEINTIVNPETIKRYLHKLDNKVRTYDEGRGIFDNFCKKEKNIINNKTKEVFTYQELMEYLFKFGLIVNVQKRDNMSDIYYSIIRNPLVVFNYKLDFQINECLRDLNRLHYL